MERKRFEWIDERRKDVDVLGTKLRFATLDTGLGEGERCFPETSPWLFAEL